MRLLYLADRPEFIPALAEWHHNEWVHLNPGDTLEWRIKRMQKSLGRRQIPTTFIALEGEELLGSASLVKWDMDTKPELTPWLASVYVAPQHRNKGLGTALVERAVEEARALGVETLYLFTPDRESFYAHMGWEVLERTEYVGEQVVVMWLKLI